MNDKKRPPAPQTSADPGERGQEPDAPEPEASERLLQAEGADGPQRGAARRRRRRSRQPRTGLRARTGPPAQRSTSEQRREVEPAAPAIRESPPEAPSDPDLGTRIRELEERLDSMIDAHARERDQSRDQGSEPRSRPAAHSEPPPSRGAAPILGRTTAGARGTARALLSTDFYLRQWGRLGLRYRSEDVDEFGYDPVYEQKVLPLFNFLYDKYFRVEVHGIEHVPREGRCLLVANHSGVLPVDGMMLRLAVRREHAQHRDVRWLAEDAIFHFPFLGSFTNRVGAVRACQENAERLLGHGALVGVFPEGMKGIGKLFNQRYKLQRFGRGGFVKLCLRTRTPVVPVAIVGSEETNPMLGRIEYLTKILGVPYLPVTPTFPWLGPLGLLPAPTKWKLFFGERIDLGRHGAESADDEILVGRLAEQVRGEIQLMLDRAIAARRSVWFG